MGIVGRADVADEVHELAQPSLVQVGLGAVLGEHPSQGGVVLLMDLHGLVYLHTMMSDIAFTTEYLKRILYGDQLREVAVLLSDRWREGFVTLLSSVIR